MRTLKGISARFFSALTRGNINIVAIAQGLLNVLFLPLLPMSLPQQQYAYVTRCYLMQSKLSKPLSSVWSGVGNALIEQIHRQQQWLKQKHIDLRVCGIANSRAMLTDMQGIDLDNWKAELAEAKEPFSLSRLIRLEREYHFLNPVIIDCTSNQEIAEQYVNFLKDGFNVVTPNKS